MIDRAAFRATIAQDEDISSLYVNEYSTAAFMSLLVTENWASKCTFSNPVDYVFDRGNAQRVDLQRAYDIALMMPGQREMLGALSFGDDKRIPALQAADLIAYEACEIYTDVHLGKNRFRHSMSAILSNMRCDIKIASESGLSKLVRRMHEIDDGDLCDH
ncbi:MAG: hypothetical protein LAP87_12875 [Acidobacteriia bacterium]|nr:hypothetical protein [Terriglobia bacterium]